MLYAIVIYIGAVFLGSLFVVFVEWDSEAHPQRWAWFIQDAPEGWDD